VGTLYVVATPIGNLEDITLRALRILKEVPLVAAEDTRVTRTLFRAHDIHTPLASFHEFTSPARRGRLVDRLADGDVALVSHGHVLRVLTARYLRLPPADGRLFRLDTGTVSVLGTEHDEPVIASWNVPPSP